MKRKKSDHNVEYHLPLGAQLNLLTPKWQLYDVQNKPAPLLFLGGIYTDIPRKSGASLLRQTRKREKLARIGGGE